MGKRTNISRNSASGRFVTTKIGSRKAAKFSAVEGVALSRRSSRSLVDLKSKGLSGDDLRDAITKQFKSK